MLALSEETAESLPMMQNKFQELDSMSIKDMHTEIEAWRNLWSYTPTEVKVQACINRIHFSFPLYLISPDCGHVLLEPLNTIY